MNALTRTVTSFDAPFHLTFSGTEIANWTRMHLGTANSFGGRAGSGTIDTVGHLMAIAACLCEPVEIDPFWCRDGGPLPFLDISVEDASPGDILLFDMDGAPGWTDGWRWSAGIMTRGVNIDSDDAQLCHVWHGHACALSWLKPWWRLYLTGACRFSRKAG